jgi:hypothetical protein
VVVDRMVVAVLMAEEAPTVAAVSRAAAHAAAGVPMTAGTSTSKVGDAPEVVAPTAEAVLVEEILTAAGDPAVAEISTSKAGNALTVALMAEVSVEETPTVAAVILRVAETSPPNAVAALMAEVTQAVEERVTVRSRDRVDFFLPSPTIPHAVPILGVKVPARSGAEVSTRPQALAISAPQRLLAISIAREAGNQCRETQGREIWSRETSAAAREDGIRSETRAAGRCPRRHAVGETRRAEGGSHSGA